MSEREKTFQKGICESIVGEALHENFDDGDINLALFSRNASCRLLTENWGGTVIVDANKHLILKFTNPDANKQRCAFLVGNRLTKARAKADRDKAAELEKVTPKSQPEN